MPGETFPGLTAHMAGMIPCRVVGMTHRGDEIPIGDFTGGVVLQGATLLDVISREIIASFSMRDNMWVVHKGQTRRYKYVFIQTQPE